MVKTPSLLDLIGLVPARDLARAAKAVGLTPEALTKRVEAIESMLGFKLVNTAAKALKPGEAGRLVIDHASRIFSQARDLTRDLDRLGLTPYYQLVIPEPATMVVGLGATLLMLRRR
jgi:LysR family nitrogen assimilation transcriptional regulator